MDLYLSSMCFSSLISSAAEGLPKEVAGLLFGDFRDDMNDQAIIYQAIPLQIAERSSDSIECEHKSMSRVYKIWDDLTPYWYVGEFHSHPYKPNEELDPSPSKIDKENMRKGHIELIISVKMTPRKKRLQYSESNLRIIGTIRYYQVEIAAWYCKRKGMVDEIELHCPFIEIINYGYKLDLVDRPGLLFSSDTTSTLVDMRKLREKILKYDEEAFRTGKSTGSSETKRKIRQILRDIRS